MRTIYDLLRKHVVHNADREAVVDGDRRVTYAQLGAEVDAVARALLARGVGRGDRVGLLAPPCAEFWTIYLAAVSIGAIWHGLNPRYQRLEYEYILRNAEPRVVFCVSPFEERDYARELVAAGADPAAVVPIALGDRDAPAWRAFVASGAGVPDAQLAAARAAVDPEDIAVIVYTSGTTGSPKGAMLSHRAIVATALANLDWMGDGLECSVCAAPINHVGALNNICMNVLAFGGRLVFHPRVDLEALAVIAEREKPTYLVSSPTGFMMMFSASTEPTNRLTTTRLIVFGGAATPKPMLERVAAYGAAMSSVYGQTETCGIVTRTDLDASLDIMADTIGKVLPGAHLRIADAAGRPVRPGETGEIQIRGPYIMTGYFRMPEATAEAFTADGYLRTGDLGVERPDGNVAFVGRLKEMFKSGGYNVYPAEVEQTICGHAAVELAVVVPRPHDTFQEVGHAYIKPRAGVDVDADELRNFLRERIANYKIPKTFSIETELPFLANGKVDRKALRDRALAAA